MVDASLVGQRLDELRQATRRPLFEELVVKASSSKTQAGVEASPSSSSWIKLVQDAAALFPFMTEDHQGEVWRLTSILLLAFLLPHSSGNEFSLQQQQSSSSSTTANHNQNNFAWKMGLEERLSKVAHLQVVCRNGTLMDPIWLLGWEDFLQQALVQAILQQPYCPRGTSNDEDDNDDNSGVGGAADLLHVLALAITPRVNRLELELPGTTTTTTSSSQHSTVQRLYRLAECPVASYFYLQDGQRQQLVQFLYQFWQPNPPSSSSSSSSASLAWQCGMAHLRASLGAWARRHDDTLGRDVPLVLQQAILALNNTTSAMEDGDVEEEEATSATACWKRAWNSTLNQLVGEDRMDYHTTILKKNENNTNSDKGDEKADNKTGDANDPNHCGCGKDDGCCWTSVGLPRYWQRKSPRPLPPLGCPHMHFGFVLSTLLLESCGRPGHEANASLALSALGDALEWQLDAWTVDEDKTEAPVTCLVTALLGTTSILFELMNLESTRKAFGEVYENMLYTSVQFLRHSEPCVRRAARRVLETAWHNLGLSPTPFATVMVTMLQQIKTLDHQRKCRKMAGLLARASAPFARKLAESFADNLLEEHDLVAAVATNRPGTFSTAALEKSLKEAMPEQSMSMVASLIALRQSYCFRESNNIAISKDVMKVLESRDPWDQYRMAIFALINGEYGTAASLFQNVSTKTSNKKNYLWIETMAKVAQAEEVLSKEAALGIPSASVLLHDALAYLDGLQTRYHDEDYSFQIRFLLLRLDILDLVTVLRQILRETRLTGQLPSKGTRTCTHIPMLFRSFLKLGKQFVELDQRFGLLWQSQRTTACLKCFRDLALFLAETTRAAFSAALPAALMKVSIPKVSLKLLFPMNHLLQELNGLVVQPIAKSGNNVDAKTTATALLQVLDGILMVPLPLPRDFCAPLPVLEAEWTVRPDSSHVAEFHQSSFDLVESFPSLSPQIRVEGHLSQAVFLRRAIASLVLSYKIRYISPLEEDGGGASKVILPVIQTTSVAMDRQGQFQISLVLPPLHEEGWFELETSIKCEAVGAAHVLYDVAVSGSSSPRIRMRNCRSR